MYHVLARLTVMALCLLPAAQALAASSSAGRKPRRVLAELPFAQARAMARALGMASRAEWDAYDCPGAYHLPKDPHVVWASHWLGWGDFLGVTLPFEEARAAVRRLGLASEDAYTRLLAAGARRERTEHGAWNGGHALRLRPEAAVTSGVDTGRLPALPDRKYKEEWRGWDDWLGL
jgi:hypothetical protein